jgi:hypothetical protein
MVSRGYCVLLDELRSRKVCSSLTDAVSILHPAWSSTYNKLEDFAGVVNAMFNAGSHYKNIEKTLGPGSWLVLGKVIPETM